MTKIAFNTQHLSVYFGNTQALTDINLEIEEGEFLGIMGPNGGGKSTLLKALLGFVPVTDGKVNFFQKKVGYVPQFAQIERGFPISAFEVALTGRMPKGISPFFKFSSRDKDIAYEQLQKVGMESLAHRQIAELSGGEFQRLLIARALALHPEILLLDEPTASVDAMSREQIYQLLEQLNRTMTIVLVTHDLYSVPSRVKKLVCLNERKLYEGKPLATEEIIKMLYNGGALC